MARDGEGLLYQSGIGGGSRDGRSVPSWYVRRKTIFLAVKYGSVPVEIGSTSSRKAKSRAPWRGSCTAQRSPGFIREDPIGIYG
jgi:hypothetical protein